LRWLVFNQPAVFPALHTTEKKDFDLIGGSFFRSNLPGMMVRPPIQVPKVNNYDFVW
jgi:hypothetical protein